ncbi:MAG: hypothetical protein ACYCZR_02330 [Burkholderiales bacterium]
MYLPLGFFNSLDGKRMLAEKMRILFFALLVAALSGCAMLTPPKEQPVIEDHVTNWFNKEKMGVFSTTAERREVIVKLPDNKFCAEPSPDVAESLASSLSFIAKGSVTDTTKKEAEARLEVAKTLATSVRTLFRRSQGAQFFRDGLFNLCQAYVNHTISGDQYVYMYRDLLMISQHLIEQEIPSLQAGRAEDAAENAVKSEEDAKAAASKAKDSASEAKKDADRAAEAAQKLAAPK